MSRKKGVAAVFAGVLLTGCATVIDYCDLGGPARCELEGKLESEINRGLAAIGSDAKVDVVIDCPADDVNCGQPAFVSDEAGDWQIIEVRVPGE